MATHKATKKGTAKKKMAASKKAQRIRSAEAGAHGPMDSYLRVTLNTSGGFNAVEVSLDNGVTWSEIEQGPSTIDNPIDLGTLKIGEFRTIILFKLLNQQNNEFTWLVKEPPEFGILGPGGCRLCHRYIADDEFFIPIPGE